MKAFNLGACCSIFARLAHDAQAVSSFAAHQQIPNDRRKSVLDKLTHAMVLAIVLELVETRAAINRLKTNIELPTSTFGEMHHGINHLLQLMQSEMEKRKVLAIEPEKTKYYQDDSFGVRAPVFRDGENALSNKAPEILFGRAAEDAFPSAYMDNVVAGGASRWVETMRPSII